jgi:hypothetical protein
VYQNYKLKMFAHSVTLEVMSNKTNDLSMKKLVVKHRKRKLYELYFLMQHFIIKSMIPSRICLIEYTARESHDKRKSIFFITSIVLDDALINDP